MYWTCSNIKMGKIKNENRLPGMIDNLHFCTPVKSLQLTHACMCVNTHKHTCTHTFLLQPFHLRFQDIMSGSH